MEAKRRTAKTLHQTERSFDAFMANVRSSLDEHAKRKNYAALGRLELADVTHSLGIGRQHGVGEIIYKAAEYSLTPRRVILEKIAGWAFKLWQRCEI